MLVKTKFLRHVGGAQGKELRDALFLHGDAVHDVGFFHGAAAVGDQDELGVVRHVPHVLGEAGDVDVVEGRFDLVEDAERRRCDLQDGEQQGDGGQALLTAGQKVDVLDVLARGLDLDADGTFEDVRLIFEDQSGFTGRPC